MIPFILAAVGGYLIGDSIGEDIDSKIPKFADGGAFNDAGEPMMTHQQYRDYSEPSELDEYDDKPRYFDERKWLRSELEKNDIFLENYGMDNEYSISGKGNYDFMIYFEGDENIYINIYDGNTEEEIEKKFDSVQEALNFILSVKDKYKFDSYDSAVRNYDKAFRDEMIDRRNNRMERGSWD